jgi:hypothetical protein
MQRQSAHTPSAVCRRMALVSADAYLPTHGGLTPAAPGNCAFVHRKQAFFRRRTIVLQHKSGGRQPPWPAIVRDTTNRRNTSAAGNRIRTSDWEKADTQRQRLRRGPLSSKPPEVEPFHTPGESDRCVFTPYIPRQPRLRGPAIHLPKPLAALLRHIFGMAGVKATLRKWGGGYNGMLGRVS